jgi:hypothetical protein
MRRGAGPRYYVSYISLMNEYLDSFVTPDAAFFDAEARAKKSALTFVVWNWRDDGTKQVRAYAHKGSAVWAKPCKKCNGTGVGPTSACYACDGLGATT